LAREDKVHRPDAYICRDCDTRFNQAEFTTVEDEDGLLRSVAVCPKCKSQNIVISWWVEGEKKTET
jgi:hypothetical protein